MKVMKIDLMDGAGVIDVCVKDEITAMRMNHFLKWVQKQSIERDAALFCVRELMQPIAGCEREERYEQARALLEKIK